MGGMDDNAPRRPREPNPRAWQPAAGTGISRAAIAVAAVVILLALGGGWYWWQQRYTLPPLPPTPAEPAPPVAAAPPAPAPAPAAPAIQHPIDEAPQAAASAPAPLTLDNADPVLRNALIELLGTKPVASMLQTDDFARRVAATVDNLGRAHAAPRLWPVAPIAGRFSVQAADGGEQIAAANAARYDAFVAFATSVDAKRSAALYRRYYPLFQRAYQELGYPQSYFNDRLVAVIDQMLATPEPATPPTVRLTEVKGPIARGAGDRPWTRYEFTDPALEALPAGSKMLLRMGPQHAARIKQQLRAFRAEIARPR
jgi:Protein of unknown function (DUF3014)